MTYEAYIAKREFMLFRKKVAAEHRCRLTAAARQRDLDKLDKEYKRSEED